MGRREFSDRTGSNRVLPSDSGDAQAENRASRRTWKQLSTSPSLPPPADNLGPVWRAFFQTRLQLRGSGYLWWRSFLRYYSPNKLLLRALVTVLIKHRKDQPLLSAQSADLAWEQIRAPRTRCNSSPRFLSLPHPSALPACCPAHAAPALHPYGSVLATGCFFGSCESDRLP